MAIFTPNQRQTRIQATADIQNIASQMYQWLNTYTQFDAKNWSANLQNTSLTHTLTIAQQAQFQNVWDDLLAQLNLAMTSIK